MEPEKREGLQGDPNILVPPQAQARLINPCIRPNQAGGQKRTRRIQTVKDKQEEEQEEKGLRGQRRTTKRKRTNQFVFVKKLDERGGDECVESLQEGVYLRLDGSCHSQLRYQLDILRLRDKTRRKRDQSIKEILIDEGGGGQEKDRKLRQWYLYYSVV